MSNNIPLLDRSTGVLSGNLLKNRLVAATLRSRLYPGVLQWATLFVFLIIIW